MAGAGSSALILFSLLISGYLFNLIFYPLRYFSSRAEGQRLFFMAAGAGIILGAFSFSLTGVSRDLIGTKLPEVLWLAASIDQYIPVPHACRLIATILISVIGAWALNFLIWVALGCKPAVEKRVYTYVVGKFGNSMSQLFRRAADQQKLVLLTLSSRKIYCGRILEVPSSIEDDNACVELLPTFSAFRDKDTLKMGAERTEYPVISLWEAKRYLASREAVLAFIRKEIGEIGDVPPGGISEELNKLESEILEARAVISNFGDYDLSDINDWIKVIPVREIESASFYDPDAYKAWFAVS
jgi:hypothetical protein